MNTATNIRTIQAAADRCTFAHGAHITASIIDGAARMNLSDAELVCALDNGVIPAPVSLMDSSSVKSLIRAARLSDAERALVADKVAQNEIATPSELRAYLQELARARVAARVAKLAPLPADQLADVAALAGNLARAERAALIAEQADAIRNGAEIVTAKPVEEIPALPGQPARAKSAQAERVVVVAGDLAWVESSDGKARYRVEFEHGVPVFCGCRDPRASFGGCKHADAAHECRKQGDGTYKGAIAPKPRRQQPTL